MAQDTSDARRRRIGFRHVMAVYVGNGLEFYDFLVFSYFAVYISRTFYPSDDPTTALLATLATFGAGFLTRPIGAIVIGGLGDRLGRKPAMVLSFTLMGIAITGLALTPSYERIGVAAPLLVLGFRLLQGFALGGEVGPTTAYMAEAAPAHRRGLYLSMQFMTQVLVLFDALSGWLSDRYGRKPVMVIPATLLVIAILPCFWAIGRYESIWVLYAAQGLMVMLFALSVTPVIVTITESLPKSIRSGVVATVYAFAISIFGGSTQFVITWLLSVTGDPLAPAYLWFGAALVGLAAMLLVEESSPAHARPSTIAAIR